MSNLLNKATAKAEQLLHKHNTTTAANSANTTHTGVHSGPNTTGGTAYDHSTTTPSTNAGPHNSNVANKLDPRVDSDLDGRGSHTAAHTGPGAHVGTGTHVGGAGTHVGAPHASSGAGYANENPRSTNHGPHSSNLLNKADPRVDSDRDASRTAPGGGDPSYGAPGAAHHTSGGLTGHSTAHTGTTGLTGHSTAHTGTTGLPSHSNTHNTGTGLTGHSAGGYGSAGVSSHTPGSGNASSTAGPHDSNLMNKLDPRVDSDVDGSKTFGGNATHH